MEYEREYVEYLQKQIKRQAEMIDAQNILIHKLIENKYDEHLLSTTSPFNSKEKV